jgi:hypothetical protein
VDAWVWETVNGRDYGTREPHFSGFVVFSQRLDHRMAQIASLALRERRTILAFNSNAGVLLVHSLDTCDDESGGWYASGTLLGEDNDDS